METLSGNKVDSAADLVARIQAGDREAEVELVERYSHGLRVIIRRELRNVTIVEDLYQETFRLVLEKIRRGDLREPEKLAGFVRSIAKNLVIAYFRQAARQGEKTEVEEAEPFLCSAPDQLEELLQKETADLVRQILKMMSNQRDIQILYRFYLAGDDKERICEDLGLTGRHFNLVLHRARERFKELYGRALESK